MHDNPPDSGDVRRSPYLLIPLLTGCWQPSPEQLEHQNRHLRERAESAAVSLPFKARHFESRVPLRKHLIAQAPVFDNTCQYLAAMAAKRARQPSQALDRQIARTIHAVAGLPDTNIGTNEYAQLFFAYSLMQDHPGVQRHARDLNHRFFKKYGRSLPAEFSELRPSRYEFSRSRVLDLLVIAEGLAALTDSPESRQLLADCMDAGYIRKLDHFEIDLGIAKIPTSSTDWLNMMRLTTLCQFQQSPEYKRALEHHFNSQQDEDNALFEAMHQLVTGKPSRALDILQDYPLITDNREIAHKPDRFAYIKNRWHSQTRKPIPIDQRGYHHNLWKRNPFEARENEGMGPTTRYHGLDFLLAYHLAKVPAAPPGKPVALVVEDRKSQRDVVVACLREHGYHVLQAGWLNEAKDLAPQAQFIITDYDLKKLGGLKAQNDGMEFLRWLRREIDSGKLHPREVIMHSTLFDDSDLPGKLFGKSIQQEVEALGFKHQPKRLVLEKRNCR